MFAHFVSKVCTREQQFTQLNKNYNFLSFHNMYNHQPLVAVCTSGDMYCEWNEFQCLSAQDGCIPLEKSCDGWIDCIRDGSDENPEECTSSE